MKSPVMRPGDPRDLPRLADLWRSDVREGRQDSALPEMQMQKMLARFDWAANSRAVARAARNIAGAVLGTSRATPHGDIATLHAAGPAGVSADLVGWGLRLAKAAGAGAAAL